MWRKRLTVYPWGLLECNVHVDEAEESPDVFDTEGDDQNRPQARTSTK